MKSEELQKQAESLLSDKITPGSAPFNLKATRGVGYAILALLEFLRESETAQVTNNCYNGCDCCNTISEM